MPTEDTSPENTSSGSSGTDDEIPPGLHDQTKYSDLAQNKSEERVPRPVISPKEGKDKLEDEGADHDRLDHEPEVQDYMKQTDGSPKETRDVDNQKQKATLLQSTSNIAKELNVGSMPETEQKPFRSRSSGSSNGEESGPEKSNSSEHSRTDNKKDKHKRHREKKRNHSCVFDNPALFLFIFCCHATSWCCPW